MVQLYVNGSKVGTLEENPDVLKRLVESGQAVEFRTTEGMTLGAYTPHQPLVPWNPSITQEKLDRRAAGPGGMTLKEFWNKSRTSEEVERLGIDVYNRIVKPKLKPEDDGKFVAVDVDTGDFEVDEDDYEAVMRLRARHPDGGVCWLECAGQPTACKIRVSR